jgi:hypothetical protein
MFLHVVLSARLRSARSKRDISLGSNHSVRSVENTPTGSVKTPLIRARKCNSFEQGCNLFFFISVFDHLSFAGHKNIIQAFRILFTCSRLR